MRFQRHSGPGGAPAQTKVRTCLKCVQDTKEASVDNSEGEEILSTG